MKKRFFLLLVLLASGYSVYGQEEEPAIPEPWLTAPLIAPLATAIPVGHVYIEPYLYFNSTVGTYNSHWKGKSGPNFFTFNPQFELYVGLTKWMDIFIGPQMVTNATEGRKDTRIGDFPVALDIQLIPYKWGNKYPSLKVSVQEMFPTGHYQRLNPHKKNTDSTGGGAYATEFTIVLFSVYHLWAGHYLSLLESWSYEISNSPSVSGFNTYGGGYGTHGKVDIGNSWEADFSFEFTFTRNWAFAMDVVYTHSNATHFHGDLGFDAEGNPASVGENSSETLALCPAIEYNFNENYGIIAGCYFSAIGRNSDIFRDGIIAFGANF